MIKLNKFRGVLSDISAEILTMNTDGASINCNSDNATYVSSCCHQLTPKMPNMDLFFPVYVFYVLDCLIETLIWCQAKLQPFINVHACIIVGQGYAHSDCEGLNTIPLHQKVYKL